MAEVMSFDDWKELGSEAACKVCARLNSLLNTFSLQAGGKYRQQGKLYKVLDGDIIFFKFNAGAGLGGGGKK